MKTSRTKPGHVSLERAFSKLGIASRSVASEFIRSGRVTVNGIRHTNPRFEVNPDRARIELDGNPVSKMESKTFLLNKPRGVVTTRSDEKGRKTVFDLLRGKEKNQHWIAVGRLDLATTGLLLITRDTQLAAWLTDPENTIPRTYMVTVRGEVSDGTLTQIQKGVLDEGEILKPADATIRKRSGKETHLSVTLTEGKNREIRRLFENMGHEVTALKRIGFGPLALGTLPPGQYRELTQSEYASLRSLCKT